MKTYLVDIQYMNNKWGCVQIQGFNPMDAHITAYNSYNIKNASVNSEMNMQTRETKPVKY